MKIGLQLYHFNRSGTPQNTGPKPFEMTRAAENAGFSNLWVMDYFLQLGRAFGVIGEEVIPQVTDL